MKRTLFRRSGILGCIFLLSAVFCKADTLTISLTPIFQSGMPGDVLTFSGTLSNSSGSTVFPNSAGINLSGAFDPTDEDTSPFFNNAPFFLVSGDSTSLIDLFTVSIPNPFLSGQYSGTFTVLGGADEDAQTIVGSADFTVQVGTTNVVPEPNSGCLLAIGLVVLSTWYFAGRGATERQSTFLHEAQQ